MEKKTDVIGIIAIIIGAIGLVWPFFLPGGVLLTLILGVVCLIFTAGSVKENGLRGRSIASIALGTMDLSFFLFMLVILLNDIGILALGVWTR